METAKRHHKGEVSKRERQNYQIIFSVHSFGCGRICLLVLRYSPFYLDFAFHE